MIRENMSREAAETLSLLKQELKEDEKSDATIEKYMRDAGRFLLFVVKRALMKYRKKM